MAYLDEVAGLAARLHEASSAAPDEGGRGSDVSEA
jgi:hypothetical protein